MRKILVVSVVMVLFISILSSSTLASIRLKGGYFMPAQLVGVNSNSIPEDGIFYGVEITKTFTGGILSLGVGVDYFQMSKIIDEEEFKWTVLPATATLYFFSGGAFYLGAGAGYYMVSAGPSDNLEQKTGFGYHGVIGYNIIGHIFLEAKYATCKIGDWNNWGIGDIDVGGISILLGVST